MLIVFFRHQSLQPRQVWLSLLPFWQIPLCLLKLLHKAKGRRDDNTYDLKQGGPEQQELR